MMKALFVFTIGPVKAFIENSRKMNDLYGGSSILSYLTEKAIKAIKEEDFEVIFPDIANNSKSNIPNRFIAKIEHFDDENPHFYRHKAEQLAKFVKDTFEDMLISSFKVKGITDKRELDIALKQVKDFLEIYWLYRPYENDYIEAYNYVFRNLHDVKKLRYFAQSEEFWGRKCTLFPEYNAIVVKKDSKGKYPVHTNLNRLNEYIDISENEKLAYLVKPKEALSAVALFKRIYVEENKIKSLRNMLFEFYYEKIKDCKDYYDSNSTFIANAVYDLSHNNKPNDEDYPEEYFEIAKEIYGEVKANNIFLGSYYACIKFDGDNVGDIYRTKKEAEQKELSKNICQFAEDIKEIIEEDFKGICIYAGGEDVLAFLPVPLIFKALRKMHEIFFDKTQLNFSAGVVVAHLMQPLKEVLSAAREMEDYAKKTEGKNAYSISVMKRSGEHRKIRHKFNYSEDRPYGTLENMNRIMYALSKQEYSKSLIYDLVNVLNRFDRGEKPADSMINIIMEQILTQKEIREKEELGTQLYELWTNCVSLQDYIDCLNIIVFLSREVSMNVSNKSS